MINRYIYKFWSSVYSFHVFDYYLTPFFAILKMINFPNQNASKAINLKKPKLDKHALKLKIEDLVRRRKEHEEHINKLVEPKYYYQDKTKSSQRGSR